MAQSPTISIPKKKTDDIDWAGPIRTVIAQSYGENPDNYALECAAFHRCRQDAVKGAGSDVTARDLLYKYFGQLELLELRFSEIRARFPWHDAFTSKLATQSSLAFEKASIIFQIASTHSSIAISQNRSNPEALKRAFYYFRTAAGMLKYIKDDFLHAPSTDLSNEVVKFLINIMLAQATEVFFEKLIDEKKAPAMVSKVATQAAYLYTGLTEEVKDFMGRGIFDRNWVTLLQIKAKYFTALSHYHRSITDAAAGKHGESLARLNVAEGLAKEAHRLGRNFGSDFVSTYSPTLPPDAGTSILDLTKSLQTLLTEKREEASRDNELIYNAVVPAEATLPVIDKLTIAQPIPIQEVYANPDVQKVIGPDMFAKLIPFSVHESASVYSEQKAKLARGEVEKVEIADSEARSGLETLGLPAGLRKWKEIANGGLEGSEESGIPPEVERWATEVRKGGAHPVIDKAFSDLEAVKRRVDDELNGISKELETESRDFEAMRVEYDALWEQEPSAGLTRALRRDLKSCRDTFTAASASDAQVVQLWQSVQQGLAILLSGNDGLERFLASADSQAGQQPSLLGMADDPTGGDTALQKDIARKVDEIEERIGRINKMKRERALVLKDLKEKIQSDDVSHLLLLNRRSPNVEPRLFAAELEKFQPYQQRIGMTIQAQAIVLDEINSLYKTLTTARGAREWLKKAQVKEKRRSEAIARLAHAKDGWAEVRETLERGTKFYRDLGDIVAELRGQTTCFVATRVAERGRLVAKAETERTKTSGSTSNQAPPALPTKSPASGIENQFSSMNLGSTTTPSLHPPPPPPSSLYQTPAATSPPPASDPYSRLFETPGISSQFSLGPTAPSTYSTQPSAPMTQSPLPPPPPSQPYYRQLPPPPPQQVPTAFSSYPPAPPVQQPNQYPYQQSPPAPQPPQAPQAPQAPQPYFNQYQSSLSGLYRTPAATSPPASDPSARLFETPGISSQFSLLTRGEVENVEIPDREARSGLFRQWKEIGNSGLEGSEDSGIPPEVEGWATEVRYGGARPDIRRANLLGRGGQSASENESPKSWLEG
ncbi:bck1-like resistance to osmotic shock [Tulasnella sp. 408]|nr:bck1-like resistance to osmotic shock [Tulasnella sp. 408]